MPFDVGRTARTVKGFGFALRNEHGGPIVTIEFASREAAEKAEVEIRLAIQGAIALIDMAGQRWNAA